MIALAWVLSLGLALWLGHKLERFQTALNGLKENLKQKAEAKKKPETIEARILDPDDPFQQMEYEQKQIMKRLNPEEPNE